MRVSTAQFYFQNSLNMSTKNSELNEQTPYLSSGKRVLTAKDDAVSFGSLAGYKNDLSRIEQFKRNITQSKNHNELNETSFSLVQETMLQTKQRFIQANNSSLTDEDKQSIADQIKQHLAQVLDIANSKNETGGFIFSGHQIDKQPFVLQANNSVIYQGDSGVDQLAIGSSISVNINQPGDSAFENITNAIGDFSPSYNTNVGGATVSSAVVGNRAAYDTVNFPPGYTLDFTDADLNGQLEVVVTDSGAGAVTTINPFVPGQAFSFNGVEVTIEGTPAIGDQFVISEDENVSIFETLKAAIDWLEVGGNAANTSQHDIDYGHILSQINTAASHISAQQGLSGINLQLIDSQESRHLDTNLSLEQAKSSIEDLDFAKAVSSFEQSQVALQAAQQTFSRMQGMSLFNYL